MWSHSYLLTANDVSELEYETTMCTRSARQYTITVGSFQSEDGSPIDSNPHFPDDGDDQC